MAKPAADVAMFDTEPPAADADPAKPKRGPGRPRGSKTRPDAPSKVAAAKRSGKPTPELEAKLRELISAGAGMLIVTGTVRADETLIFDGKVIAHQAPALARDLKALGDANPLIGRALNALVGGAGIAPIVSTLVGTAVPIAVAHGILPSSVLGLVPGYPLAELGAPPEPRRRDRRAEPPAARQPSATNGRVAAAPQPPAGETPQQREARERLEQMRAAMNGGAAES